MNVLFIGNVANQFSANLAKRINNNTDIKVDAIFAIRGSKYNNIFENKYHKVHWYNLFYNPWKIPRINGIINTINLIICLLKVSKYDIIHLQYLHSYMYFLLPIIKLKSGHIVATVWGSDFGLFKRDFGMIKRLLISVDYITCAHEEFKERVRSVLHCVDNKIKVIPLPTNVIDEILSLDIYSKEQIKIKLNIPLDHLVICCGTNARRMQHHLEIIDEIARIHKEFKKPVYLLFPMSYGEQSLDYIKQIDDKLKEYAMPYKKKLDFMTDKEVAMFRIVTDILIQVQDYDQMSGAMLETIYANNLVITGNWLPYSILDKHGTFYFKVDKIEDIHELVLNCVNSYDTLVKCTTYNRQIVEKITGNSKIVRIWADFYEQICS